MNITIVILLILFLFSIFYYCFSFSFSLSLPPFPSFPPPSSPFSLFPALRPLVLFFFLSPLFFFSSSSRPISNIFFLPYHYLSSSSFLCSYIFIYICFYRIYYTKCILNTFCMVLLCISRVKGVKSKEVKAV